MGHPRSKDGFGLAGGALTGLVERAFAEDFSRGRIGGPYVVDGVLVCPGGLSESGFSHRCRFVSIDDQWCFDHPGVVLDDVRWAAGGPGERAGRRVMTSVTLVAVDQGAVVDAVRARIEGGVHRLVEAVRYEVSAGALVAVGRRRAGEPFRWPDERESEPARSTRGGRLARADELLREIDRLVGRGPAPRRSRRLANGG